MPPEQGSSEGGQGTDQGTSSAGTPPGQGAPDGAQGTGSQDGGQSQQSDDAAKTIARLNAEAKQHREAREAAEAKLREIEQAGMSDLEKARQQLAQEEARRIELENKNQELRLSGAVRAAAVKAKAVDPDLVWRTIDLSKIDTDGDGQPTNLDALMTETKKAYPVLFERATGSADGGAQGGSGPTGDMNELIRRGARRGAPA